MAYSWGCKTVVAPRIVGQSNYGIPFGSRHVGRTVLHTTGTTRISSTSCYTAITTIIDRRVRNHGRISVGRVRATIRGRLVSNPCGRLTHTCVRCHRSHSVRHRGHNHLGRRVHNLIRRAGTSLLGRGTGGSDGIVPARHSLLTKVITGRCTHRRLLPHSIIRTRRHNSVRCRSLSCSPFFPVFGYVLVSLGNVLARNFGVKGTRVRPPGSVSATATMATRVVTRITDRVCNNAAVGHVSRILTPFIATDCGGRHGATRR